ncbi:MAG TPA: SIMPL domain-containing protein [Pyrinomonadaceae bacterium]|jgi:uncharacterized protein YggE
MKANVWKFVLIALGLVIFAAALYLYRPPAPSNYTRVAVTGEAQTDASPDTALVSFSVVTQNAGAVAAQQENARKIEAVMKALESAGGARQEIKTSNYQLTPEQDYSSGGMPKIVGYEARNTVTVSTDRLDQTGALIDAATRGGANSVEGISFNLRDDSRSRGDALGTATRQAMAKAEAIAESLGGKIVRVVETVEGGATPTPIVLSNATTGNVAAKQEFRTQIQAGAISVRGQVTLVVEIDAPRK